MGHVTLSFSNPISSRVTHFRRHQLLTPFLTPFSTPFLTRFVVARRYAQGLTELEPSDLILNAKRELLEELNQDAYYYIGPRPSRAKPKGKPGGFRGSGELPSEGLNRDTSRDEYGRSVHEQEMSNQRQGGKGGRGGGLQSDREPGTVTADRIIDERVAKANLVCFYDFYYVIHTFFARKCERF